MINTVSKNRVRIRNIGRGMANLPPWQHLGWPSSYSSYVILPFSVYQYQGSRLVYILLMCTEVLDYTIRRCTSHTILERFCKLECSTTKRVPIPSDTSCTDSRPPARWYQLRGLPLVGSECVCPQCNSLLVITWGSAKPSAFGLPVHLSRAH